MQAAGGGAADRPLPVSLLGLDPVFWTYAKLFVADVHQLVPHPDVGGALAVGVECTARRPVKLMGGRRPGGGGGGVTQPSTTMATTRCAA